MSHFLTATSIKGIYNITHLDIDFDLEAGTQFNAVVSNLKYQDFIKQKHPFWKVPQLFTNTNILSLFIAMIYL